MPDNPTDTSSSTSCNQSPPPPGEPNEPTTPPPPGGDTVSLAEAPVADGDGSRTRSWEEGRPHWWAGFILGMVAVLISGSTAVWTALKPDPAPVTVPAPVVNNYMPEAAGLNGQPTQPTPDTGCEMGDNHFAGWGPDRPMMASAGPYAFDYPTLNGYNEDPHIGDTRNFYRVKNADAPTSAGWSNEVRNPVRGERYSLSVYVINSGYLNDVLTAKDVRVTVTLPNCRSRQIGTHGTVASSNTYPAAIWGGVNFYSGDDFALTYVRGSAKLYNNAYPQGLAVPGTAFLEADGQPLGYEKLDGYLPAGFQYAGYFQFTVEVV